VGGSGRWRGRKKDRERERERKSLELAGRNNEIFYMYNLVELTRGDFFHL
jgi:hypothetical protein